MSSLENAHIPQPLKINGLWKFFPEMAYREGDPDSPPLGPFRVRGDSEVVREGWDIPVTRFLILSPEKGCTLPAHEEYVVEYPKNLIAADFVTFERKKSARWIRAQLAPSKPGVVGWCQLRLRNQILPVHQYVIYEEQVEGTWIPVEADGRELRP